MDKESIFTQLKWAIQAMACNSETQITLFPEFIVASDEMINDFDYWRRTVEGRYKSEFSPAQIESLTQIDIVIDEITKSKEEIWDSEALATHELWGELRIAAANTLKEFNWPVAAPVTTRSFFVAE